MNIFFISYQETNCEENWKNLLTYHPSAIRLHGIVGINTVHLACDSLASTEYFWTVDGDNFITSELTYNKPIDADLLMFKAVDPLYNDLTLLGGVKLWKKGKIIEKTMNRGDFTLNATANKKVIDQSYSITQYNDSPFDAWKTSFRHCVKLTSMFFRNRPHANNIDIYVNRWKETKDLDQKNANWAYQGYQDAISYTEQHDNNIDKLNLINNYDWLKNYFLQNYEPSIKH
jgi:hypothetical protein